MDSASSINLAFDPNIPAHLFIGPHDVLLDHIERMLQKNFCKNGGCGVCTSCQQIRTHQHHAVEWFHPEKQYTREDLEPLFNKIGFALDNGEQSFFILQKADSLTTSSGNSLLKSLEEPKKGYYFMLLAERIEQIIPTIRSRCTLHYLQGAQTIMHQNLYACFTLESAYHALSFTKILDQSKINERESIELLDALLRYWIDQRKEAIINHNGSLLNRTTTMITLLTHASEHYPMPGSSKLFWKNIFLQSMP